MNIPHFDSDSNKQQIVICYSVEDQVVFLNCQKGFGDTPSIQNFINIMNIVSLNETISDGDYKLPIAIHNVNFETNGAWILPEGGNNFSFTEFIYNLSLIVFNNDPLVEVHEYPL